jgi:hypothetical protein
MMRIAMTATAVGVAGVLWAGVAAQQEMLPKPGPGSGITKVIGAVSVSNTPDVRVVELPPITIAAPPFVRKSGRYEITWADGDAEKVTVLESGPDGWVQVEGMRRRWVNLRAARTVEESR